MINKTPFVSLQVLERKDLSKAGDLFSLEDSVIVDELSAVIKALQVPCFIIKKIFFQAQEKQTKQNDHSTFRRSQASPSF